MVRAADNGPLAVDRRSGENITDAIVLRLDLHIVSPRIDHEIIFHESANKWTGAIRITQVDTGACSDDNAIADRPPPRSTFGADPDGLVIPFDIATVVDDVQILKCDVVREMIASASSFHAVDVVDVLTIDLEIPDDEV